MTLNFLSATCSTKEKKIPQIVLGPTATHGGGGVFSPYNDEETLGAPLFITQPAEDGSLRTDISSLTFSHHPTLISSQLPTLKDRWQARLSALPVPSTQLEDLTWVDSIIHNQWTWSLHRHVLRSNTNILLGSLRLVESLTPSIHKSNFSNFVHVCSSQRQIKELSSAITCQ